MLYQRDSAYVPDSSRFTKALGQEPMSYAEGVRCIALAYKSRRRAGSEAMGWFNVRIDAVAIERAGFSRSSGRSTYRSSWPQSGRCQ